MSFFRLLRITALLALLVIVAGSQWLTRARVSSWDEPIWITIYPVLSPADSRSRRYVESLSPEAFADIGQFLGREGARYRPMPATPLMLQIAQPLIEPPPEVPVSGSRFDIALWSLRMRWWSWRRDREDRLPSADIQMFVLYRGTEGQQVLEQSVGMQKGMYGIVNAFASRAMASRNRVVIAHELLHILGASDKYDRMTGQPLIPDGLAEPGRDPLYPQERAEIMAGRIARSGSTAEMPAALHHCVVGRATAREIGWLKT